MVSEDAVDLISRLLQRDPVLRLGTVGSAEVRDHFFFDGIDWQSLLRQKVAFVPQLESEVRGCLLFLPFKVSGGCCGLNCVVPNSSSFVTCVRRFPGGISVDEQQANKGCRSLCNDNAKGLWFCKRNELGCI